MTDLPSDLKIRLANTTSIGCSRPLKAEIARLEADLATYQGAFETTAADRDRLAQELAASVEEKKRLEAERDEYRYAFKTTATDRDRVAAELARVTNRTGNKPSNPSLMVLSELALGILAHVLMNEVKVPADQVETRLASFVDQHQNWVTLLNDVTPTSPRAHASDGLLRLAEFIMREAVVSELALQFVDSALALDDRFRGANHALWTYYWRKNSAGLGDYFAKGVNEGAWPDQGTRVMQRQAIERGIPSTLLVALPKSGSVFVGSTIRNSLEVPNFSIAVPERVETAGEDREVIVPELVKIFAEGGVSTAHHFAPTTRNLTLLKENGVRRFILHIRDPRQAAVSWWYYHIKIGRILHRDWTQKEIEEKIWDEYFVPRTKWVRDWLDVIETDPDFEIMVSTQEELAGREHDHISGLLDFMSIPRAVYTLDVPPKTDAAHFRKGSKDEWLEFFSDDFKQRSLEFVPNELARCFSWQEIN